MEFSKIKFGVNAVVSGQKSATVNALPQLIANSTLGKFSITSPVSKALGIAVGENIMFLNNLQGVKDAISDRNEGLVAWAAENGVDFDSEEGHAAILKAFGQWYLAKGQKMYDSKGNPIMKPEKYTTKDKEKFIAENGAKIAEANREALLARLGVEDATLEELIASITVDDVQVPEYHASTGAKTATTSTATGVGCALNFTDTSIWNSLKGDIAEDDRVKVNRVFDVNLEEAENIEYYNGYETISIKVLPISFKNDETPKTVGK